MSRECRKQLVKFLVYTAGSVSSFFCHESFRRWLYFDFFALLDDGVQSIRMGETLCFIFYNSIVSDVHRHPFSNGSVFIAHLGKTVSDATIAKNQLILW